MIRGNEDLKKSFIQKIFSTNATNGGKMIKDMIDSSDLHMESVTERSVCSGLGRSTATSQDVQSLRVFTSTWNVGGKSPHNDLNLDNFLQIHDQSDIYVLGFQEIVPLNAGNVLAIDDNRTVAKWLSLISQSLNKLPNDYTKRRLKSCNCIPEPERKYHRDLYFKFQQSNIDDNDFSSEEDDSLTMVSELTPPNSTSQMRYSLIKSKQMVGIFVTIWVKKELVQHIGHLRTSCISRGIMGYLGNKGCISVSMSVLQTSFCFVCSHLASGEKEGDELRRNSDVIEIIKNTQFSKICRRPFTRMPEKF